MALPKRLISKFPMKSLPTPDPGSHTTNLTSTLAKGLKHCKFYSKGHRHSETSPIVKIGFLKAESSNRAALGYVKVTPALQGDGKSRTSRRTYRTCGLNARRRGEDTDLTQRPVPGHGGERRGRGVAAGSHPRPRSAQSRGPRHLRPYLPTS